MGVRIADWPQIGARVSRLWDRGELEASVYVFMDINHRCGNACDLMMYTRYTELSAISNLQTVLKVEHVEALGCGLGCTSLICQMKVLAASCTVIDTSSLSGVSGLYLARLRTRIFIFSCNVEKVSCAITFRISHFLALLINFRGAFQVDTSNKIRHFAIHRFGALSWPLHDLDLRTKCYIWHHKRDILFIASYR